MKGFLVLFFCLLSLCHASPMAPVLNHYSLPKYKFGFWFIAEASRSGQTSPKVQYILEVLVDRSDGWFQPIAPIVVVPGSVLSFETIYGDGQEIFTPSGFARIRVEYISPIPKDKRPSGGWVTLKPIQF